MPRHRDQGAGRRRTRHHHRRRDPPRELLESLRHRARGDRPGQSGHGSRSQRSSESGAARGRRPSADGMPSACAISSSCAAHTERHVKATVPGPFTMAQQAQIDLLRWQPRARGDGLCGGGKCRDPRSVRCRCGRRADRRTVHAGAPGGGACASACRRSTVRSRAVMGTTAVHICFGYAAIIHVRPSGYSFLPELAECSLQAGVHRDRAVEPGLLRAPALPRQEDHPRRH